MRIGMLGPLEVTTGSGEVVELAGARLRTLLIMLALEPGRVVSQTRLIDGIWGTSPPAAAQNAVQALVSRLRKALPEARVEPHPSGYRLAIDQDHVDVTRFEHLLAQGRFAEALRLWRGPALVDVAQSAAFAPQVARLTELRLTALEACAQTDPGLLAELVPLAAEHPLRERLTAALMRALCTAGRPAEALTLYERTRQALAEDLGTDPSPELSGLHLAILRGDPLPPPDGPIPSPARTNLRVPLTSFVGREQDVARVGELVGDFRLTTLTGPGGAGKTRLATETARGLRLPDGVWLVELAQLTEPAEIPHAVLAALGIREQSPGGEPVDRIAAALRDRDTLLLLDNCEHLIEAVAALADRLLGTCQGLRILATSREPLGITGEAVWPVEPLALPPEDAADITDYPAVRLLLDRARPGLEVTRDVARICRALDGIPLAIELAAARLRTMSAEQVADRLDDRFRLLNGGSRVALPRHRTLRAVVDWSWDLLSAHERILLRRLAVFSGGATVEAAERVCADGAVPGERVLDLLASLTDKSLLVAYGGALPYRMLETIKEYGLRRLEEAGEREAVLRAHAAYCVELAEAADPRLRRGDQVRWLRRLAADSGNLNAALRGAVAAGDGPTAVRLVAAAGWYWYLDWALTSRRAEGTELAAQALALPDGGDSLALSDGVGSLVLPDGGDSLVLSDGVDPEVRATALAVSGLFELNGLGNERRATEWFGAARELTKDPHPVLRLLGADARADDDPWVRAMAGLGHALTQVETGGHPREELREALAEFRAIGERLGISTCLTTLADLAARRGDLPAAITGYEQAVEVMSEIIPLEDAWHPRLRLAQLRWLSGDTAALEEVERDSTRIGVPDALLSVTYAKAELARWAGDLVTARALLDRTTALARDMTVNGHFRAALRLAHGYLDTQAGDLESARAHHAEALSLAARTRSAPAIGQALVGVADLALHRGQPREAARLLAAVTAVCGGPDLSVPDTVRVRAALSDALSDALTGALAGALTGEELAEASRLGGQATLESVIELAAATLA